MKALNSIIIREWKRIFSIPNYYVVLLVIPVLVFFFFGLIYQKQFAREFPVAVWDDDHSSVSRTLANMMDATVGIHITEQADSEQSILNLIQSGKIAAAVYFPKNMEADAKKGKPTAITLYTNASGLVASQMIYKDAAQVIIKGGLAVILQKSQRQGMPADQAMALVQPVKLNTVTLYNPEFNYQQYLAPGLITVGLQMALIIASVLILNLELARNTIGELLAISRSPSQIIVGKTLAHLAVSWISFILIFFVVFPVFGLDKPGTIFNLFILFTLLSLACIGIGLMVSALSNNLLFTVDLALFYTAPAFVFSGFTFPRSAMPWYDQYYAAAMPYTHFMDAFIRLYYMGLPPQYVTREMVILLLFCGVTYPVAVLLFQFKIKKFRADETHI